MKMYQSPRFEAVEFLSVATMQAASKGPDAPADVDGEAPRRSLIPGFSPKAL